MGLFLQRYKMWVALLVIAGAASGVYAALSAPGKAHDLTLSEVNGQMEALLETSTGSPSPSAAKIILSRRADAAAGGKAAAEGERPHESTPAPKAPAAAEAGTPPPAASAEAGKHEQEPAAHAEAKGGQINLNTADLQRLQDLPGIGESKAKAILAYRQQNGAFKKVEDVMKVKGIGPKIFAKFKSMVTI